MQRARHQKGAVAVEFALCCVAFLSLLLMALEVARFAYLQNAAAEATRLGARTAAMCDPNGTTDNVIYKKMRVLLPQLTAQSQVKVSRKKVDTTTDCTSADDCAFVTVSLNAVSVQTIIPLVTLGAVLPGTPTTLPREFMNSTNNAVACTAP